MVALDSLITQLIVTLPEDLALGLATAERFGSALQGHFDDKRFPAFLIPEVLSESGDVGTSSQ